MLSRETASRLIFFAYRRVRVSVSLSGAEEIAAVHRRCCAETSEQQKRFVSIESSLIVSPSRKMEALYSRNFAGQRDAIFRRDMN